MILLGGVPAFFGLQTLNRDPVFASLDELDVPDTWAAADPVDDVSGSRWCLLDCRLRERTVNSERSPKETAQVYEAALSRDGWQLWTPKYCPEQEEKGSYTCWRRDCRYPRPLGPGAHLRTAPGGRRAGGRTVA